MACTPRWYVTHLLAPRQKMRRIGAVTNGLDRNLLAGSVIILQNQYSQHNTRTIKQGPRVSWTATDNTSSSNYAGKTNRGLEDNLRGIEDLVLMSSSVSPDVRYRLKKHKYR